MNDNFVPETSRDEQDVPYYDDVSSEGGWQGHATEKSEPTLQAEITQAIGRLGGMVVGFQKGAFGSRMGYRVHYTLRRPDGQMWPGKLDIAALPVKPPKPNAKKNMDTWNQRSLKMALYMTRVALEGSWFLKQLAPGYNPLMPWMLMPREDGSEFTIAEAFDDMLQGKTMLPEPKKEEDAVEGEFSETP